MTTADSTDKYFAQTGQIPYLSIEHVLLHTAQFLTGYHQLTPLKYQIKNDFRQGQLWGLQLASGMEVLGWQGEHYQPHTILRSSTSKRPLWTIMLVDDPGFVAAQSQLSESASHKAHVTPMAYLYNSALDIDMRVNAAGSVRLIAIRIKPEALETVLLNPPAAVNEFFQTNTPQFYAFTLNKKLLSCFAHLSALANTENTNDWGALSTSLDICSEVFRLFCDRAKAPKHNLQPRDVNRLIHAHDLLLADFQQAPSLEWLCKEAGLGRDKLRQLFRQVYGATPHQYFQKRRMEYAHQLIEQGNCNIQEVGYQLGYSHLGHFAEAFKQQFGYLPRQAKQNASAPSTQE